MLPWRTPPSLPVWRSLLAPCGLGAAFLAAGCTRDFVVRPVTPPRAAVVATSAGGSDAARETRRATTARLVEAFSPELLAAGGDRPSVTLPAAGPGQRPRRVRLVRGPGPGGVSPGGFVQLEPTDRYAVSGVDGFHTVPGEGAPLVGHLAPIRPVHADGRVPAEAVNGLTWPVTAVARPGADPGGDVTLELYEPHAARDRDARGRMLAADYTTPLAVSASRLRARRRGLLGFISGGNYFPSAGLYPTEPRDPDKIPLILVHGLISDPGDFRHLRNALAGDPAVRRRYQVWVFYYPTSLPVPYSAMLLREDLGAFIRRLDPAGTHTALHRAVLVGHSMGGLLCRLAVTDGGDVYYRHFFRRPLPELQLTAEERDLIRRGFLYRASPDVTKVVFIATPHRGSRLAGGLPGNVGRLLVRLPPAVLTPIRGILTRNRTVLANGLTLRPASSLDTLSPRDPAILSLNETRPRPGVRLFSVLGDRGRSGPLTGSSDGVVPYASSHLDGVESERAVPAGHVGTLQRPETADELRRILRGGTAPPPPARTGPPGTLNP